LNSRMGEAMVKGFQGTDLKSGKNVVSTLKHFTAYGNPEGGHNGGSISVGKRELYQSYLPPFEAAVKAGALSVMTAYNSIDGVPCTASHFLLTEVLRGQWNFKGFTVSDLGSISGLVSSHRVVKTPAEGAALAINAGLDADLSGYGFGKALIKALKDGLVKDAALDTAVSRVLKIKFDMGLFDNPFVSSKAAAKLVRNAEHISLARKVAQQSIVLLKNEKQLLPLSKKIRSIAVIGPNADNIYNQLGDYTAPQSEDAIVTVLEGIKAKVPARTTVTYAKGTAIRDTSSAGIAAAVAAARNAEVAIVVLGGSSARDFKTEYQSTGAAIVKTGAVSDMESGEGFDRSSLDLMGRQMELLQAVVKTGTPVVVVLIKGRPLNINWAAENVPAILDAWYPGQEGGNAIADVLFGDYNPAGRLPVSIPRSVGQLPVYYNFKNPAPHDYVEIDAKPLYSFGYGLSYSSFEYSKPVVRVQEDAGKISVKINVDLKNTSNWDGEEVVQIYLRDNVSSVVIASRQLKDFRRVAIKSGEQKTVEFELTETDLALLDKEWNWIVEPGEFEVLVGASSDDVKVKETFSVSRFMKVPAGW